MRSSSQFLKLLGLVEEYKATVGVIGLGYVGLPLAVAIAQAGYKTIGFDVDERKRASILKGNSYIDAVSSEALSEQVQRNSLSVAQSNEELNIPDVIIICVPTPLTKNREPDTSFIENTAQDIKQVLRSGQVVILESTTYPGTTTDLLGPILEKSGLKLREDFFLGFSPEREDPGNKNFNTVTIPKIVSGDGEKAAKLVQAFYSRVVASTVLVSNPATAEATKLTENIFRAVNIALVNELKLVYDKMGIDVWEVIEAAKTKPFGYMAFYPGPGLGGHCIPIDPFYLTWASRAYEVPTRFIELAGEINVSMPQYVVSKTAEALDRISKISLSASSILVIGVSYKKNVTDMRESPSLRIMEILEERGATVSFYDPHVPVIPSTREHASLTGRESCILDRQAIQDHDLVLIATDHDLIDFSLVANAANIVVDTRNAIRSRKLTTKNLVKA